jgi:hypothetical protein
MKATTMTTRTVLVISLVVISLLCYEQPDPGPSVGEINVIVGTVWALVLSLRWGWSHIRGLTPSPSH